MENHTKPLSGGNVRRIALGVIIGGALGLALTAEPCSTALRGPSASQAAHVSESVVPAQGAQARVDAARVGPALRVDPTQIVGAKLRPTLRTLAAAMVEALPLHPQKAAYDACIESGRGERCASVIADVVDYALFQSHALERIRRDEFGVQDLVEEFGEETVASALGAVVASSGDSFERTAALMLRSHALGEGALPPLPAQAYRELAARPLPEANLIAEEHRRVGVPQAVADEFAQLAEVADARAQRSAVLALGHAETADQLHQAVLGLSHSDRLWNDVAMAVSVCGMPCADTLQVVARTGPEAARVALYEAATFAPSAERAQLVAMTREYVPSSIGAHERELQEAFLRTALSE